MVDDSRVSRKPVSGTVDVPSGDSSNFEVVPLRDEETMSLEEVNVDYDDSSTAGAVVEIYDTGLVASGSESDLVDKFRLSAGEERSPDMEWRDIDDGLLVTTSGNQDGAITVTAGGFVISG